MTDNNPSRGDDGARAEAEMNAREALGRFGHHPDPAIDFEIEVQCLEARLFDAKGKISKPGTPPETVETVKRDIERAMDFRVGGDVGAIDAKHFLRKLEAEALSALPAPQGDDGLVGEIMDARQKRAETLHIQILEARDKIRVHLNPESPSWLREAFDALHAAHHNLGGDPFDMHMRAALAAQAAEIAGLKAELDHFKSSGIIEIAVRNPRVSEYIDHWEGRTEAAEANYLIAHARAAERDTECFRLESRLASAKEALTEWMRYDALLRSLPDVGPIYGGQMAEVDAAYDACVAATATTLSSIKGGSPQPFDNHSDQAGTYQSIEEYNAAKDLRKGEAE